MSEDNRLDRLEIIVEKILEGLQETKQRTDSNARAIEALSNTIKEEREQRERDRDKLYQALSELATAQASFYSTQATMNQRLEELDKRQGDIVEIIKFLVNKDNNE